MCSRLNDSQDSLQHTLQIMGDKWTALIIRQLTDQAARFCDMEVSLAGISPRTLSQRLTMLEQEGIVARRLYCEHPPRYTYGLTQKGQELRAILVTMTDWGTRYARSNSASNS